MTRALWGVALLATVASGLFFQDLGRYPLLDPDEARHAEVARELGEAHGLRRLFLPTLELVPYREKPAGFYWLVAAAYGVAGVGAGPARAVSALAALVTVLAVYVFALPRGGVGGALAAGLVLATSAGWFVLARLVTIDMTLTACVTVGVLAGLTWLERPPPRRPPLTPYVAAALGTLVKGPIAILLTGGPLVVAAASQRTRPTREELGLGRGLVVAGFLVAMLYLPMVLLDSSYALGFLWTNVRRFGPESPHAAPAYYYLLWVPVLLLPWTALAVPAVVRAARDPARRALVLWAGFVPAFLSLARGKLAPYALSVLPPLALVLGLELARAARAASPTRRTGPERMAGWVTVAGLIVAGAAALAATMYPITLRGRILLSAATFGWAAVLGVALHRGRLALVPMVVLGAALTTYPLTVRFVAPAVAALRSDQEAARRIATAAPGPVIAYAARAPSLAFYLRTPLVNTSDARVVRDLFSGDGPAFLVTGRRHFDEIEQLLGERAHLWYATPRRRLYANRPPPTAG